MRHLSSAFILFSASLSGQTWTQLPDFPGTARDDAAAFAIGEDVFVGTGMDAGFQLTTDWYRFNTSGNTWEQAYTLPIAGRQYCATFVIDTLGYLFGGTTGGGAASTILRYDPYWDYWTILNSDGPELSAAVAYSLNGTGYVALGKQPSDVSTNGQWQVTSSGTWSTDVPLPTLPMHRSASFVHDGHGYVVGGAEDPFVTKSALWEYDPPGAAWEPRQSMPEARYSCDAVGIPNGAVVVGGATSDPTEVHDDVWHYLAGTDSWESYPPFPGGVRRGGVIAFVAPNKVYYGTGSDNVVRYKDWWVLEFPVGIQEDQAAAFSFSPVPADAVLHVSLPAPEGDLRITDLEGRSVFNIRITGNAITIPTRSLASGAYVISLRNASGISSKRFTVLH